MDGRGIRVAKGRGAWLNAVMQAAGTSTKLTHDERFAAVVEKVRAQGFQVPPRDAWRKRLGARKDSEHFDEALRLGAEWRSEVNRESLSGTNGDS